jgi:hypothetical protein
MTATPNSATPPKSALPACGWRGSGRCASARLVPIAPTGWEGKFFSYISMTEHMQDFAGGIIDTRPVVMYLSLTIFFVFMTFKVVESRRWK